MAILASHSGSVTDLVGIGYPDGTATHGTTWATQFTAGASGSLTGITATLSKNGSPSGAVSVTIYSDSSGVPGSLLATGTNFSGITTQDTYSTAISGASLVSGTKYWLVLSYTGTASTSDNYRWYAAGTGATSAYNPNGSGWTSDSRGFIFEVDGNTSTSVTVTPTKLSSSFTAPAVTFSNATSVTTTPTKAAATVTAQSPTVTAAQNVTIAAAVLALIFTLPSGGSGTAGPNSPSSASNDLTVGTVSWSNPGNVFVSDNANASATSGSGTWTSRYLAVNGFGFSVPTNASISGIVVEVEKSGGGSFVDNSIKIIKANSSLGTAEKATATAWPSSDSYVSAGGATDLWGETWTPANINNTAFGVAVSVSKTGAGPFTATIDHIRITVYYTTPGVTVITTSTATIAPSTLALSATATAPTIKYDYVTVSSALSASFALQSPTILTSSDVTPTPSVASASFTAQAPTITAIKNVTVSPSVATASFSAQTVIASAGLTTAPSIAAASFTAQAVTVATTWNVTATPTVTSASLSVKAPTVTYDYSLTPTVATATFTMRAPSIVAAGAISISPSVLGAQFTAQPVVVSVDYVQIVAAATATLTAQHVTVTTVSDIVVTPPVAAMTATTPNPAILSSSTVLPTVLTASSSVRVPAISTDQVFLASVLTGILTPQPVTVIVVKNFTVSPSAATDTFTTQSPAVVTQTVVFPATLVLSAVPAAPIIKLDYVVAVARAQMTFSLPAPTRTGGLWTNEQRPTSSWANEARTVSTFTNDQRPSTTWSNEERPAN